MQRRHGQYEKLEVKQFPPIANARHQFIWMSKNTQAVYQREQQVITMPDRASVSYQDVHHDVKTSAIAPVAQWREYPNVHVSEIQTLANTQHSGSKMHKLSKKKKGFMLILITLLLFSFLSAGALHVYNVKAINNPVTTPVATYKKQIAKPMATKKAQPDLISSAMSTSMQKKIEQLTTSIDSIRQKGKDVTTYQRALDAAKLAQTKVASQKDYVAFLIQTGIDLSMLQDDLAGGDTSVMRNNLLHEAQQWGDTHQYHDPYDGKNYDLDTSYMNVDGHNSFLYGEGAYLSDEINAGNPQAAHDIQDAYFLLSMLEANYEDPTPYNQPHQVDQYILKHFDLQNKHVLLVSLTEQSMRIYNNGKLEEGDLITTGRVYRPTPIGLFQMTQHFYDLTLISGDAPTSPDYYTPVVVHNAIQFWDDGYYVHSAQWRKDYGPNTQFPHQDSGGDPEARVGSHGCINVNPSTLNRLDATITMQTQLLNF